MWFGEGYALGIGLQERVAPVGGAVLGLRGACLCPASPVRGGAMTGPAKALGDQALPGRPSRAGLCSSPAVSPAKTLASGRGGRIVQE